MREVANHLDSSRSPPAVFDRNRVAVSPFQNYNPTRFHRLRGPLLGCFRASLASILPARCGELSRPDIRLVVERPDEQAGGLRRNRVLEAHGRLAPRFRFQMNSARPIARWARDSMIARRRFTADPRFPRGRRPAGHPPGQIVSPSTGRMPTRSRSSRASITKSVRPW